MNSFARLAKLAHKQKFTLYFSIIFMLLYAVCSVAPASFMKDIVDSVAKSLKEHEAIPLDRFYLVGFGLILLIVIKGISYFTQTYLMGLLGQRLIRDLRDRLYKKVISMPVSFFNARSTGELTSRFTVDFATLNNSIKIAVMGPLRDVPQIAMLLYIMFNRSWRMFLLTLILLPVAAWLISLFGNLNKKVTKKRLSQFGELNSLLTETITGSRVVKAFSMEEYEYGRFKKENFRLFRQLMKSILIASYSYPALELSAGICGVMILVYGGYLSNTGVITWGDYISFMTSFILLNEPIKKLNGINLKIQEGLAAASRIFKLLDSEIKIHEIPDAKPLKEIQKEINVKIDAFKYDDQPVLQDINISLKAGTITALVGSSGSGKTTLANLIPRFFDLDRKTATITIDGIDIRDVTIKSLRDQIAIVTQEVILFNDTISNNISYGDINCSKEKIIEAAKAGYAHNFISELPDGYEQQVGEKGARISGGQRQRVAISRALIKNAPILILDEATSALDTESEKEVQAAIENLMKNRTTLVIAHRLSTIQHADIIHVLKSGRIIESGSHQELIKQDSEYKRLYDMQFQTNP